MDRATWKPSVLSIYINFFQTCGSVYIFQYCYSLFLPSQSTKLALHSVDDKPAEELPKLTTEQLESIKSPDVIKNEIALLEDRCAQMKPNLGAIAEFKKKVCGHCFKHKRK